MDLGESPGVYRFDRFTLDLVRGTLLADGAERELRPKAFALLRLFVENPGRLIGPEEIMRAIWPGIFVSDDSIFQCIREVRRALGDAERRMLRTVPRRGYRFVAQVSAMAPIATFPRAEARASPSHSPVGPVAEPFERCAPAFTSGNSTITDPTPAPVRYREAERRPITALSCELMGVAPGADGFDLEDLREAVRTFQRCVSEVSDRRGGLVARSLGNSMLVLFGYPTAHEHDAEQAVKAGLELCELVRSRGGGPGAPTRCRVGIATGMVIIGDLAEIGSVHDQQIVGEAPNLAARLLTAVQPDVVAIDRETRRLIGRLFDCRELGAIKAMNSAEPLRGWQVLGKSIVENRFQALHGSALSPLFGRNEEIDLLLRRWERAGAGDGQIVLVSGEAGIGKSRLVAALQERLDAQPHLPLRYFCSPHHQDSALYPIVEHLSNAASFLREDPPAIKLEKIRTLLGQAELADEDIAFIADLMSLAPGPHALLNISPQRRKQGLLQALIRHLEGLARRRPLLVAVEDVHWIDPTSRELLDLMVERIPDLPALLIVTFRPEFQAPWAGQPRITTLALNRLGEADRTALIARIAGGKALPDEIVRQIADHSDGVPLFVEELTWSVLAGGLLREEGDRWALDRAPPTFAIPTTLHASLLARLDQLGTPGRWLAQIGAAIGRQFAYVLLHAVSRLPEDELQAALTQLVASGLVLQRGTPPDAVYSFKHALVQDAAYGSLLRNTRQQLHAAIAHVLEQQLPEYADTEPEVLAHHFSQAAQAEPAVKYWLKAGHRSAARSADAEAVRQLQRGLEMLLTLPASDERDQMELEFQLALGTPLISLHGWNAAPVVAAYERASVLCERLDNPARLSLTLFGLHSNRIVRGDTRTAQQLAERLGLLAERTGDPVSRLLAHRAMGVVMMQLGEFTRARSELTRITALYHPERDRSLAARCIIDPRASGAAYLALVLWLLGYPEQAQRTQREAFRYAAELGHANTTAHILCHAGAELAQFLGDVPALRAHATAVVALAADHHMPLWSADGVLLQGCVMAQEGRAAEGLARVRQGMRELAVLDSAFHRTHDLAVLAEIHARLHDPAAGLDVLAEAQEEARRTDIYFWHAELHRLEGELRALIDAPDAEVEACFASALALARRQRAKSLELRAAMSLARLRRKQRRFQGGYDVLAPVYDWFTEGFGTPDLQAAKALLDELCRLRPPDLRQSGAGAAHNAFAAAARSKRPGRKPKRG